MLHVGGMFAKADTNGYDNIIAKEIIYSCMSFSIDQVQGGIIEDMICLVLFQVMRTASENWSIFSFCSKVLLNNSGTSVLGNDVKVLKVLLSFLL